MITILYSNACVLTQAFEWKDKIGLISFSENQFLLIVKAVDMIHETFS